MNEPNAENDDRERRLNDVLAEYMQRADRGDVVDREKLLAEHPDLADELRAYFDDAERIEQMAGPAAAETLHSQVGTLDGDQSLKRVRYFGDYELLEEIARGGMGVVFKARQMNLNRTVALKMILAGQLASDADVRRFRAEAEAAANLQHPNIVAIHEVGQHQGQHYFSMDYVAGQSLADMIRENPLPPRKAAQYVKTVAEAIEYAHTQGTLHRDLKPSNVLIDAADSPRITDFGLAKRVESDSNLTATNQVLGTPSYMPPEQAAAKHAEIGPASDVYSLGAILYELLTGRPPFRAATAVETLVQVLDAEPAAPRLLNPKLPQDLETITLKCLAKQPARRYASAIELANDLGRYLRGEPIHARRVSRTERAWRWCKRNPLAAGLLVAVMIAIVAGVAVSAAYAARSTWAVERFRDHLTAAVKDRRSTVEQRADAARALFWALGDRTEPVRLAILDRLANRDADWIDREFCLSALAQMGPDENVASQALRAALEIENGAQFYELLDDVGVGPMSIPQFLAVLPDRKPHERDAIIKLLDQFVSPEEAVNRHIVATEKQDAAGLLWSKHFVTTAGAHRAELVPQLTQALSHDNPNVRAWAASALLKIGSAAETTLTAVKKAQDDPDEEVRWRAALAASVIERPPPAPETQISLEDVALSIQVGLTICIFVVPIVLWLAVSLYRSWTLSWSRVAVTAAVIAILLAPFAWLWWKAANREYPLSIGTARFRLKYGNKEVRGSAAQSMVASRTHGDRHWIRPDPRPILAALEEGLFDLPESQGYRRKAIGRMADFEVDREHYGYKRYAPRAVAVLTQALADQDYDTRKLAGHLLSWYAKDAAPAVPELAIALDDWAAARGAAHGLSAIGPDAQGAIPALKAMAARGDATDKAHALFALLAIDPMGNYPFEEAIPLLEPAPTVDYGQPWFIEQDEAMEAVRKIRKMTEKTDKE